MTQCLESIPVYDQRKETEPDQDPRSDEDFPDTPRIRLDQAKVVKMNSLPKRVMVTQSVVLRHIST